MQTFLVWCSKDPDDTAPNYCRTSFDLFLWIPGILFAFSLPCFYVRYLGVIFKGRMAFRPFWFGCSYTAIANPAKALRAFKVLYLRNHRFYCCSFHFSLDNFVWGETSSDFPPFKCFFHYLFCGRDWQEGNMGYCAVFISTIYNKTI